MTKLEQAARQALGALEVATTPMAKDRQEVLRAITTLREALGGVQALSAAPAGFVPVAAFDRLHAHAESLAARLLAAEQAAPKAAPGEPSAFPMTGDEEESDLGQWQPGTAKPNMDGTYLREFDEGEATSEFHQGVWLRDGFFPSELQDVRWRGRAAPQPAPAPLSDDVVKDAARWRMAALIGNELMLHLDKRTHATAVKAYMDATHSGSDLTGAVDAAIVAQGGKA